MRSVEFLCRNATTFSRSGELDEDAFREFLQRFIDAHLGVYIGALEGHALTRDELRHMYRIGVAACKGKIAVNGNPPEQHTAREFRDSVLDAVEAGTEVVNVYGPAGLHGYQPTDAELRAYFDSILSAVRHPVALAPLAVLGYTPKAALIAEICNKYSQVVAVNLASMAADSYLVRLKDALNRDVKIYVPWTASLNALGLGAAGLLGVEANIIPGTLRRYMDLYERGDDPAELSRVYAGITRLADYVSAWRHPRWIKMAMKVLKLPGGEGGMREPYRLPEADELQRFSDGLLRLGIAEIDAQARAAGLL